MLLTICIVILLDILSRVYCGEDGKWHYEHKDCKVRNIDVVEVRVMGYNRTYTYLSNGRTYYNDELIMVPFGRDNTMMIGTVVRQKMLAYDELPVPYSKMKSAGAPLHMDATRRYENAAP